MRLTKDFTVPAGIDRPRFTPENHGIGIVHLGLGAFHRAHQSVYTDAALAKSGGNWRTLGVSLRGRDVAEQLNPQDGRYTLVVRGPGEPQFQVIGNIAGVCFAPEEGARLRDQLAHPATKIVSLTITEKGYGLDRATGGLDRNHPAIAADLANPSAPPQSAVGLIVAALATRHAAGHKPFTVLSCDNFAGNGRVVGRLVVDFAREVSPALADWIERNGRFPSSMVDRITPASTPETLAEVSQRLGVDDLAAVQAEPFTQWIIEDDFADGRPEWEAGGAQFVSDVTPYEEMKLRMLNGTHSTLAYSGYLSGRRYIRDTMADEHLRKVVQSYFAAAAATLDEHVRGEAPAYAEALTERFANPAIAHETYQIAMDGTQKLPQRVFASALVAFERGTSFEPFAFSTAAWMRYALGRTDDGETYRLRDPREEEIAARLQGTGGRADVVYAALSTLPGLMPQPLQQNRAWKAAVVTHLGRMLDGGMAAAIRAFAA